MFTGLVPVDSVSAGCANFCVLSEYDIGKVTGDLTGKIPQTLHVIGCLRSPVDLLKSVRDQENILVNQFHNHAQQLKILAASGQSNLADKRLAATKSSKFGFRTHTTAV